MLFGDQAGPVAVASATKSLSHADVTEVEPNAESIGIPCILSGRVQAEMTHRLQAPQAGPSRMDRALFVAFCRKMPSCSSEHCAGCPSNQTLQQPQTLQQQEER